MRASAIAVAAAAVVTAAGCGGGSGGKATTTAPTPVRVDRTGDRHVRMGDNPTGIVAAGGRIVAASVDGTVTRVDPATDRVLGGPITVGDETAAIAAGEDAAWVLAKRDDPDTPKIDWFVVRVDPADGATRVVVRVLGYDPNELAVDRGTIWVTEASRHAVERFDARTGRALGAPIHTGPEPWGLAVGGRSAWVGDSKRGTLTRVDARSGRIAGRVDGFPHRDAGFVEEVFEIAVDKGSTWVLRERSLVRVSGSGVVGRTRIPGVANTGELSIAVGALLVGTESRPGRVYRVNPRTGKLLGTHPRPIVFQNAINGVAYLDGSVWVATNDGDPGTPDEIIRTTR
jgi:DNA-binding beta-propeller fold protein YncE